MSEKRRYFWCDAPSPLHAVLRKAHDDECSAIESIQALAESLGAKAFVGRDGFVSGFVFDGKPPSNTYHWKKAGTSRNGDTYYVPAKRTADGKALSRRLSMRWYQTRQDAVIAASGLSVDAIIGRYFCRTSCGFSDDRIFLSVPISSEAFPDVPDYLTECKEWEMQRWFDLGRNGIQQEMVTT